MAGGVKQVPILMSPDWYLDLRYVSWLPWPPPLPFGAGRREATPLNVACLSITANYSVPVRNCASPIPKLQSDFVFSAQLMMRSSPLSPHTSESRSWSALYIAFFCSELRPCWKICSITNLLLRLSPRLVSSQINSYGSCWVMIFEPKSIRINSDCHSHANRHFLLDSDLVRGHWNVSTSLLGPRRRVPLAPSVVVLLWSHRF